MSYAQAISSGRVLLRTPTGEVTLSAEEGHRLIFHGAPIYVNDVVLERHRRTIFAMIGGTPYTVNACNLGRVFKGEAARCRVYPVEITSRSVR